MQVPKAVPEVDSDVNRHNVLTSMRTSVIIAIKMLLTPYLPFLRSKSDCGMVSAFLNCSPSLSSGERVLSATKLLQNAT